MKLILPILVAALLHAAPVHADCDKAQAREVVEAFTTSGMASREENGITVWYHWRGQWHTLGKDKQMRLIHGLAAVEHCLRPGVTTRIRFAGKDVARGNAQGVQVIE